jgi:hypothetical protein
VAHLRSELALRRPRRIQKDMNQSAHEKAEPLPLPVRSQPKLQRSRT